MNISILKTDLQSEHDVMLTRQRARQIASLLGFDTQDQTRIATAVSEIARNAVEHAGGGKVEFRLASGAPQALQIIIKDEGPGLPCVQKASGMSVTALPECGESLRGARRLMDEFHIESAPDAGTCVTLCKRRSRLLSDIERKDMARITAELTQRISADPLTEMQRQNQELLHALAELRGQQEERAEHLREIEALNQRLRRAMVETHHRVKNNLQVISALIDMQQASGQETVAMSEIVRLGHNIQALSVIHDLLTREAKKDGDASYISVKGMLERLIPLLQSTLGGRRIVTTLAEARLPGKQATSLALVANELISNAIKHAAGDIEVTLHTTGGHIAGGHKGGNTMAGDSSGHHITGDRMVFTVSDDGQGFGVEFNPETSGHTGLELIENIVRHDLHGVVIYENGPAGGARVELSFPLDAGGD